MCDHKLYIEFVRCHIFLNKLFIIKKKNMVQGCQDPNPTQDRFWLCKIVIVRSNYDPKIPPKITITYLKHEK